MATSDLIKYLEPGASIAHRRTVDTFIASGAITLGDAVSVKLDEATIPDVALKVMRTNSAATEATCFVGVALETVASGERVKVCVGGLCLANVNASCVEGSRLTIGTDVGRLSIRTDVSESGSASVPILQLAAIACEADTSNYANVFVIKQF